MRRRPRALRLTALAGGLVAIAPAGADTACPAEAQGFRRLKTADAEIAYRWEPAELRVGQFFAAEVVACRAPGAEPVGQIAIDATMPAHGHGMNYRPKVEAAAAGHYRFTGLMLHMPGTWRLTFDLFQGGKRTRLTHQLDLKR
jgi:YtkA-like protein